MFASDIDHVVQRQYNERHENDCFQEVSQACSVCRKLDHVYSSIMLSRLTRPNCLSYLRIYHSAPASVYHHDVHNNGLCQLKYILRFGIVSFNLPPNMFPQRPSVEAPWAVG